MGQQLFNTHTLDQKTDSLANLLPNGQVFGSKFINDSNFRKLLSVFSPEMLRFENYVNTVALEHDITCSNVLLGSWEKSLVIPDDCFSGQGSLSDRRRDVIIKFACMNVSTEADIKNIAEKLGIEVTIRPIQEPLYPPYSIPMIPVSTPGARFVWIVESESFTNFFPPYDIPLFLSVGATIFECILKRVKPAFVKLIFTEPGVLPEGSGFSSGFSSGFG